MDDNTQNIDIEIEEPAQASVQRREAPLPQNFVAVGSSNAGETAVYIKQDVYHALEAYSREDTDHERGTVLLGYYKEEFGRMNVVIFDYIEARSGVSRETTFTITHEAWEYIYREREKRYPEAQYPQIKLIGWQHTHPRFGIFLSGNDEFIQGNFFSMPYQVAYVIDPVNDTRGVFQWKGAKSEKLGGFYVYDDPGKPISLGAAAGGFGAPVSQSYYSGGYRKKEEKEDSNSFFIMLALFCVAMLLCGVLFVMNYQKDKQIAELERRPAEQTAAEDNVFHDGDILKVCEDEKIVLGCNGEPTTQLCGNAKHNNPQWVVAESGAKKLRICPKCYPKCYKFGCETRFCPECGSRIQDVSVAESNHKSPGPSASGTLEQDNNKPGYDPPKDIENTHAPKRPQPGKVIPGKPGTKKTPGGKKQPGIKAAPNDGAGPGAENGLNKEPAKQPEPEENRDPKTEPNNSEGNKPDDPRTI